MAKTETSWCTVHDVQLEMVECGQGRPILLLQGKDGLYPQTTFLNLLTNCGHVMAPSHPGFGHSPEVDWVDTVDDLSYLYLDFLAAQNLQGVIVIGLSLGGWIAAEMAVKSTERIAKLVLVAPVGIKVGDRETRDIPDIFALSPNEAAQLKYHDPAFATVDYSKLSEDQLTAVARSREATVLYAWEPYFHNPKLRRRLRRIHVPTLLLWGANDQFVTPGYYGAAYLDAIPGARLEMIDRAGHMPHIEQPEILTEHIRMFIEECKT